MVFENKSNGSEKSGIFFSENTWFYAKLIGYVAVAAGIMYALDAAKRSEYVKNVNCKARNIFDGNVPGECELQHTVASIVKAIPTNYDNFYRYMPEGMRTSMHFCFDSAKDTMSDAYESMRKAGEYVSDNVTQAASKIYAKFN